MQKIRRFISIVLIFSLLISQFTVVNGSTSNFGDINNHWAKESMTKWYDLKVVKGTPEGLFLPDKPLNRAEVVALLNRILGLKNANADQFDDVTEKAWYAQDMLIAKSAGYLLEYDTNTINAEEYVTRQETVALIDRAFQLPDTDIELSFSDQDAILSYQENSIKNVVSAGGISGYPDGSFQPRGTITKAEFLTVVDKLVGLYINEPGTYSITKDTRGSVIVNSKDVIIENSTISNNLYITENVGDGDVTLKNTIVEGNALVQGGGENSIKLYDCKITSIIINRKEGKVRVVANGETTVGTATVNSNAKLESTTVSGFENITLDLLNTLEGYDIELEGEFGNVTIDSKANVSLIGNTKINQVTVSGHAKPTLQLSEQSQITSAQINGTTEIKGNGTIKNASVNAENVVIETKVENVLVSKNIEKSPIINGKEVTENKTNNSNTSQSSNTPSNSGGSSNPVDDSTDTPVDNPVISYPEEKYLVNDYPFFTLYSTKPLLDNAIDPTSLLLVEFLEGYTIESTSLLPLHDDNYVPSSNHVVLNYDNSSLIKAILVIPENPLEFNTGYKIRVLPSSILNLNGEPVNDTTYEFYFYTCISDGSDGPMLFQDQLFNTIIYGSDNNSDSLEDYFYTPGNNLIYSIENSHPNFIDYKLDDGYLSLYPKSVTSDQITLTVTAMDSNGLTATLPIYISIIDAIDIDYNINSNYIQVTYKNNYYLQLDPNDLWIDLYEYYDSYYSYDDRMDIVIDDIDYFDQDNNIIKSYRVYPSIQGNKIPFNNHAVYTVEVPTYGLCNSNNEEVDNLTYNDIVSTHFFKESYYENEYFTVYSSYPLVDGKIPVDAFLLLEFKEGYTVLQDNKYKFASLRTPTNASAYRYDHYPLADDLANCLYIEPLQTFTDSSNWFYSNNTDYILKFNYDYLVDMNGDAVTVNESQLTEITLETEDYLGSNDPLSVGTIPDGYLIEGQIVEEELTTLFYSTKNKTLSYDIQSSDVTTIGCSINNKSYEDTFTIEGIKQGTSTITIAASNGEDTPNQQSFNVEVIESPVLLEYLVDINGIGYTQLTISNDYTIYESSLLSCI